MGPQVTLNVISPPAATAQPVAGASALRQATRSTTSSGLMPSAPPPPSGRVKSRSDGPAGPAESNGTVAPVASLPLTRCSS